MRALLLDNEAVCALRDVAHGKHRVVLAHLQGAVGRRKRRAGAMAVVVATAVRVEAGWDRSNPRAAAINRYRITDAPLDTAAADLAAAIALETGVSVADAHLGATIRSGGWSDVVVLTSDPDDMHRVAGTVAIRTVRL